MTLPIQTTIFTFIILYIKHALNVHLAIILIFLHSTKLYILKFYAQLFVFIYF